MPWNEVNVYEQRIRFAVLATRGGESFQALCERFGISRTTGYKWRDRYLRDGVAGLEEHSRKPHTSPQRTSSELEERVVELRRKWPDWGARKLRVKLAEQGVQLTRITIHRILQRHGMIAEEDQVRPATTRFERSEANQLWQMDFKGLALAWKTGDLMPLSILDDHSRYLLELRAHRGTGGAQVRETLERVFSECGLPDEMLMDHGTPWWNMQGAGWTRVTVWLMQQGIKVRFCGYRHPQTQGKVERMHGSLNRALKRRGRPGSRDQWQPWLDGFRLEYNQERPHEALGMATPSSRWEPSRRRFDPRPKRWEYEAGSLVLRVGVNGGLGWRGRRWEISRALSHQWVALEPVGERVLVRYCRTTVRELDLKRGRSLPVSVNPQQFVWPSSDETDEEEEG